MSWKETARNLILKHEGMRLVSYKDSLGYPTIGIGFLLSRKNARSRLEQVGVTTFVPLRITEEQALALLDLDISDALTDLRIMFDDFDTLSDNRKAVLVDMYYNLGGIRLRGFVHFIAAVRKGLWQEAGSQMLQSDWSKQVGARAVEDQNLLVTG